LRTIENTQYSRTKPGGISNRIAAKARVKMYEDFIAALDVGNGDTILDVGVTSDEVYEGSNYLEAQHPNKNMITATGIDNGSHLEQLYPGVRYIRDNGLSMQFPDRSFDFVHSSAVIEHVGNRTNQAKLIAECARVARKGFYITTPNRWFPIEVHTKLVLVHWLPAPRSRTIMRWLGMSDFANEANLNLMTRRDLLRLSEPVARDFDIEIRSHRLMGWGSNLLLVGWRR